MPTDAMTVEPTLRAALLADEGERRDALRELIEALGADGLVDRLAAHVDDESDVRSAYDRQCSLLALASLHDLGAAPALLRLEPRLVRWLEHPRPEVRFQAAGTLAAAMGDRPARLEALLRERVAHDEEQEVRDRAIELLGELVRLGPETLAVLRPLATDEGPVGLSAARVLAGQRDPTGVARLIGALEAPESRDDALEALAVLGALAPASAHEPVARLAERRGPFGLAGAPAITRVRAAYALARMSPQRGLPLLDELAHGRDRAVREAVDEARSLLARLAARDREAIETPADR